MATLAQAKRDFSFGLVESARIQRVLDYLVIDLVYSGKSVADTLDDVRTKQPRQFKTFDAAIRAVEEIGFQVNAVTI